MRIKHTLLLLLLAGTTTSYAQLNQNPNKFLGNITTMYQVRPDFEKYWDQLTPENETKWGSIEGTRDVYNWATVDAQYNYCKDHGFKFKFHTLVWGGQYPSWMNNLSKEEQLEEIEEWFDAVAERYPDLEYIDVVNEALSGHAPAPYKAALGGDGTSGYDWIVKAFQMARDRWPNAVLIYNDYNTFQWDTDRYIDLLQRIIKAGAPVDAAGCQSHDLNDMSGADFKKVLEKVHDGVQLPIFISEYDISKVDDQEQLKKYQEQFPVMWEADYVAGVTLWGYIYGSTWDQAKYSGLIKNNVERPALEWLREYMQTDAAKNAKSPLIKPASDYAYITATPNTALIGDKTTIVGKASSTENTIAEVRLYCDNSLVAKFDTSAFSYEWSPIEVGNYTFKMQVLSSVSSTLFDCSCSVKGCEPGKPFSGTPIALPGKFEAEHFDIGENGVAYSDNDAGNNGTNNYRDADVDIDKNDGDGWCVGWTNAGEWMEYTVNVAEEQLMIWTARVASGTTGSGFQMYFDGEDLTGNIEVPKTDDSQWKTYVEVKGRTLFALPVGTHKIRLAITGSSCNIDCITFSTSTGDENLTMPYSGKPIALPGVIQAENFDLGMAGEAYYDSEPANQDDKYRKTGVDIVEGNNGYALGYTAPKEWVVYTVTVAETQKFYWKATVSSGSGGGSFKIVINDSDADVTGEISVPSTSNWNTYKTVTGETVADLPAGTYKLRLEMVKANCNVDKIEFRTEPFVDPTAIADEQACSGVFDVFTVMGIYRGTVEINDGDTSVLQGRFEQGIYILRNKATGEAKRVMVK